MNILKLSRNVALTLGVVLGALSSTAMAVPCTGITNIGQWELAGSCDQGDKLWTIGANNFGRQRPGVVQ